jgi:hypothetical protein
MENGQHVQNDVGEQFNSLTQFLEKKGISHGRTEWKYVGGLHHGKTTAAARTVVQVFKKLPDGESPGDALPVSVSPELEASARYMLEPIDMGFNFPDADQATVMNIKRQRLPPQHQSLVLLSVKRPLTALLGVCDTFALFFTNRTFSANANELVLDFGALHSETDDERMIRYHENMEYDNFGYEESRECPKFVNKFVGEVRYRMFECQRMSERVEMIDTRVGFRENTDATLAKIQEKRFEIIGTNNAGGKAMFSMVRLELSACNIGCELLITIANVVGKMSQLRTLDLSDNDRLQRSLKVGGGQSCNDGVIALADTIRLHTSLAHFDLSECKLGASPGLQTRIESRVSPAWHRQVKLNTELASEAICQICRGVGENTTLKTVNLRNNPIVRTLTEIEETLEWTARLNEHHNSHSNWSEHDQDYDASENCLTAAPRMDAVLAMLAACSDTSRAMLSIDLCDTGIFQDTRHFFHKRPPLYFGELLHPEYYEWEDYELIEGYDSDMRSNMEAYSEYIDTRAAEMKALCWQKRKQRRCAMSASICSYPLELHS